MRLGAINSSSSHCKSKSHQRYECQDPHGLADRVVDSDEFGPVPQAKFGPRDGGAVEAFYNFQVTPWLNVSPDIQIIKPGAGGIAETAFIYGVRVNMTL